MTDINGNLNSMPRAENFLFFNIHSMSKTTINCFLCRKIEDPMPSTTDMHAIIDLSLLTEQAHNTLFQTIGNWYNLNINLSKQIDAPLFRLWVSTAPMNNNSRSSQKSY